MKNLFVVLVAFILNINLFADINDMSKLRKAIENSNNKLAIELLEKVDINAKDENNRTILSMSVYSDNIDLTKYIIKKGGNIRLKTKHSNPILHWCKSPKMADYLISKGINIKVENDFGYTALHNSQNFEMTKYFVKKGVDPKKRTNFGATAIRFSKSIEEVKYFEALGLTGFDKDNYGRNAIHHAANPEIVKYYIDAGMNINEKDIDGYTPLHNMIDWELYDSAKFLINKGANINIVGVNNATILMMAINRNQYDLVKLLIKKGAKLDIVHNDGYTALQQSINNGNDKIAKLLIDNGAKIKKEEYNNLLIKALEENMPKLAIYLINKGANVNLKDSDGDTVLALGVLCDNLELVKLLIKKGANIKIKNQYDNPILFYVESDEMADYLISLGTKIKDVNKYGCNILHAARNLKMAKYFVKKGLSINKLANDELSILHTVRSAEIANYYLTMRVDINSKNKNNQSSLDYAILNENNDVAKFLINKGININSLDNSGYNPLMLAIMKDNFEIANILLNKGVDVNISGTKGWTALMLSCWQKNSDMLKLLLKQKPKLNLVNYQNNHALNIAIMNKNRDAAKLLIAAGSNLNIIGSRNESPLIKAIKYKLYDVAEILINKGANLDIVNEDKKTALILAIKNKNKKLAYLLIKKGALINNVKDYTSLSYALDNKMFDLATFLIKKGANVDIKVLEGYPLKNIINWYDEETEFLKAYLSKVKNINDYTSLFKTVVIIKNRELINYMISRGINLKKIINDFNDNIFSHAIYNDNFPLIKKIIKSGVNINQLYKYNRTPLAYAVLNGKYEIAKYLIKNGAKIKLTDKYRDTPILRVRGNQARKIIKLLIENGANIDVKDERGKGLLDLYKINYIDIVLAYGLESTNPKTSSYTPLMYAVMRDDAQGIKRVFKTGSDINSKNYLGQTPLILAAKWGCAKSIKTLIKMGADLTIKDKNGNNALYYALEWGDINIINLLTDKNIDTKNIFKMFNDFDDKDILTLITKSKNINGVDDKGDSFLIKSIKYGRFNLAKKLIELGIDVDIKNNNNLTALAVLFKYLGEENYSGQKVLSNEKEKRETLIANILIEKSKNINIVIPMGYKGNQSLFEIAISKDRKDLINKLISNNYKLDGDIKSTLIIAIENQETDLALNLIQLGINKKLPQSYFEDALFSAIKSKNMIIIDKLLKQCSDLNIYNRDGATPLLYAASYGNYRLLSKMISDGANLHAVDNNGENAIFYSSKHNNYHVIDHLLNWGININSINNSGETAIFNNENIYMIEYLLERKLDINIKSTNGNTFILHKIQQVNRISKDNIELFEKYIKLGADITVKNNEGKSALMLVIPNYSYSEYNDYYAQLINLILKNGVDINHKDKEGKTVIFYAISKEDQDLLKLLLDNKASTDIVDNKGLTPFKAIINSDMWSKDDYLQILCDYNAHLGVNANNYNSPLIPLAINSIEDDYSRDYNLKYFELFLENKFNPNVKLKSGETLLEYCIKNKNEKYSLALLKAGCKLDIKDISKLNNLIEISLYKKNYLLIQYLVDALENRKIKSKRIKDIMFDVIESKNNWSSTGNSEKSLKAFNSLIENIDNINYQNDNGKTFLINAIENNEIELVKKIIKLGANINIQDKNGNTAIFYTIDEWSRRDIKKYLLESGADILLKNNKGDSALDIESADSNGDKDLFLKYLGKNSKEHNLN